MEKRVVGLIVLIMFMFSISFASAEVFFSQQPREVYNYGDQLEAVIGTDGGEGWVNVDLICNNATKLVFFHYLQDGETEADVSVPLTKEFLRDLMGSCHLSADFNSEFKDSLVFSIDDSIGFDIVFNKNVFEPNETVFFTGTTNKLNGQAVEGFVEVKFTYNAIDVIVPISDDEFVGNISLPNNIPSGDYSLEVFAYEKNLDGEVTNSGFYNTSISVSQRPNSLIVAVQETIVPNNDLEFTATLTDQSGSNIDGVPVAFTLINVEGEQIHNVLSSTGITNYFRIQSNAPFGYWNISAESEGIVTDYSPIYVDINKEASFDLVNNTLLIRNIGNIHYDNLVEISVGNYTEVKNLNLSLGKSAEFDLFAPDGNYSIKVTDGELDLSGVALLTGDAIRIKSSRRGSLGFLSGNVFAWVFIIAVLGLFIFVSSKKILNKKMILSMKNFKFKKFKGEKGGVVKVIPGGKEEPKSGEGATHSLVLNGDRQQASIIALKIKNQEEIDKVKSNASDAIKGVTALISENNGRVYKSGNYILGLFAPSITRTFDNTLTAVRVAQTISDKLKEHNRKYAHKIDFGIGAGEGNIIARKENNRLLFTPIGNTLSNVKKIADISERNVLISEATHKKIGTKLKSSANKEKFGIKSYSVGEMVEDHEHNKFINRFLERNEYKKLDKFKI